jgi:hypothetical protein
MKHTNKTKLSSEVILDSLKAQYRDIQKRTALSIEELVSPKDFRFDDFCKNFVPHPDSRLLSQITQAYGEKNDIWLPNAKHHITCALYLYPSAGFDRMLTMMKNLTLGFYLNDTMGRDTFRFQSEKDKKASKHLIEHMQAINDTLYVPSDGHPLEYVNAEILREFRDHSPEDWFGKFLEIYCYHIGITHMDGNTSAQEFIPTVEEYEDRRCHLGGVHHILMWIEYSDGKFLDWDLLNAMDIAQALKRLHWAAAAFAGLVNDLFSFEKEVIDHSSDSNLVAIVALNDCDLTFMEAIAYASSIVKGIFTELISLMTSIRQKADSISKTFPSYSQLLIHHLDAIVRCVQATWKWQCFSNRYKRLGSIWIETSLKEEITGAIA